MDRRNVVPLLHRLERFGYVTATWGTSEQGRRRKHYAITPSGRDLLEERRKQWHVVNGALDRLWRTLPSPTPEAGSA